MNHNSRDRSLGRTQGRRMTMTGRASAQGTLQWRRAHAEPLPPGRCYCPECWHEFSILNGFPRRHGCRPARAVVLLGPALAAIREGRVTLTTVTAPDRVIANVKGFTGKHIVDLLGGRWRCSCQEWTTSNRCPHILAVRLVTDHGVDA